MLRSWFRMALRQWRSSPLYTLLNLTGLAIGITVALLTGLWITDELSFNGVHKNHDRLAQVLYNEPVSSGINTGELVPIPLAAELKNKYGRDFPRVALLFPNFIHIIASGDKKLSQSGVWAQPDLPEMLTLDMLKGNRNALGDRSLVLLSQTTARSLFGDTDPMNKTIRVDNTVEVKIGGVFKDLPTTSSFYGTDLFLSWDKGKDEMPWFKDVQTRWDTRAWKLYVEMNPHADLEKLNAEIKDILHPFVEDKKQTILLHPMNKWRLYGEFSNGNSVGGRIRLVWLFGAIGLFVLLLACINFMNLSTARSQRRAKEVGIRKTLGSGRGQLIRQFLSEATLVTLVASIGALGITALTLPVFGHLAGKTMFVPWSQPLFWLLTIGFILFTGLIAGSYPAFYLSRFRPVKILKGDLRAGPMVSLPRKILVVIQFTVSVSLIIATVHIHRQIQYAKDRPVGYTRQGLLKIGMNTPELYQAGYNALRNQLLQTGAVEDMAQSSLRATEEPEDYKDKGLDWEGKDPAFTPSVTSIFITHDYGRTLGWQLSAGRDFSRSLSTDSDAVILNAAAARLTGLTDPIGKNIRWSGTSHHVIGVVKDMVMSSPYQSVLPGIFLLDYHSVNSILVRVNPTMPMRRALAAIEPVFRRYNPSSPFDYTFVDDEYALKFSDEERVAGLSGLFTFLAVFISCLGLFGLASYEMEQRTKEIGIRKVLGAPVLQLWQLLTKDFVFLVLIAGAIAIPLSAILLQQWLRQYEYRTTLSAWVYCAAAGGALGIALLTISFHALKAARTNPIKSLRSE